MAPSTDSQPDFAADARLAEFSQSVVGMSVSGRARVRKLAAIDLSEALKVARKIEHPWYRCQALSSIVEVNPSDKNSELYLEEAFDAAYSQSEPNRIASVSFWPLSQLSKMNTNSAATHVMKLLEIISKEPHGLRRLDGLRGILLGVISVPTLRNVVLPHFLQAIAESAGWRTERIVDVVASVLLEHDHHSAKQLLDSRPASRFTRKSRSKT